MPDNVEEARRRMYFMVMERLAEIIDIKVWGTYVSLGTKVLEHTDRIVQRNIVVGDMLKDEATILARCKADA
ncbi:hypothetical protein [Neorhizobium sp. T6_25]|uniref:hypothetical protein n=1 Tax=Neorhizobium sp. T6_25 TaxID=2093833 RepID=UPI00155F181D|nr:hypothetical protein [Neorhizobium sp. T6_25]